MQWKTRRVKQPPALIKAFCIAFYFHHGNYAAAPKHPRQTTKEEADCPPPTHRPFMYHIPWLRPFALPDLQPGFNMIKPSLCICSMTDRLDMFEELKTPVYRRLLNVAISHKRSEEQRTPYRNREQGEIRLLFMITHAEQVQAAEWW